MRFEQPASCLFVTHVANTLTLLMIGKKLRDVVIVIGCIRSVRFLGS